MYLGNSKPKNILIDHLHFEGLNYHFKVVDLKSVSKDVFLQSGTPEGVILAILADFGADKPKHVVQLILQHLLKLVGRVPQLRKYQKQLHILSRLRKLSSITYNEILTMPIHYEIETDELYLEGIEKGIEKGREEGIELAKTDAIVRMLKQGKYALSEIILILGVKETFVRKTAAEYGLTVQEG